MDGRLKGRVPESSEPADPPTSDGVYEASFLPWSLSLKNTKDEAGSLHNISGETAVSSKKSSNVQRTT